MGKKHIIVLLITLALAFFHLAEAQQAKKVPWIGYLAGDPRAPTRDSFRQGLKDFGYVEGQSILIEWRFAEDKLDRVLELAAELVRLKLDVIVAGNANAVKALKRTTTTIPIVIAMYAGDPVADGVVTSLAKPGWNITGVIPLAPELSGKRLEFLKEMLPKLSHVAVMWNPDAAATRSTWEETQTSARALGMAKKIGIDPKALGLCERGKRPLSKKILKFLENF